MDSAGKKEAVFRGSQSVAPATKSTNEPYIQKIQFIISITKSKLLDNHRHIQSALPTTKIIFRNKTAPIPYISYEKESILEYQIHSLKIPAATTQI